MKKENKMDEELLNEKRQEELPEEEPLEEEQQKPLEEPRFAVNTVLNADCQLEASRAVNSRLLQLIPIFLTALAAAAAGVLLWLYLSRGETKHLVMLIVLLLMAVYMIYSRVAMPKKAMQRWEQNLIMTYGCNALHLCTEFYDRALAQTFKESGELITEGYSEISECKETEHLFLLRYGAQQWFFIEKSGFTVGTAEEFRAFITERIGG